MTGKQLKDLIAKQGVQALAIAKKIGISPQALSSTFKAADVKSGTIERIAEAMGVKMSYFYPDTPTDSHKAVADSGGVAIAGNNNVTGDVATGDNAVLKERVAMLERLLDEKERTIKILMDRK